MKYIFSMVLFLMSLGSYSQTGSIEGEILFENEAGASASIEVLGQDTYSITDQNGKYLFQNLVPGTYQLRVTSLGYIDQIKSVEVKSEEITKVVLQLKAKNNTLDEVVIIDRQTGLNSKTPYNYTPVSMDRIENKSSPSGVMGILREVPGVYGAEFGQGIVKPFIRGLGFSRVATIFQGNKLENQQWGADHGLGINDLGVERIDVIKGPASVLYGSGALGGVILIHDDEFYKNSTRLSGNIGTSFNSVSRGLRTYGSAGQNLKNNLFYGVELAYENHADYISGDGNIIGNSRYNMSSARVHAGIEKENFDNKLSVSYSMQNLGIIGEDELMNSNATTRNDRTMQLPFQEVTDVLISYNQHIDHGTFESFFHVSHHYNTRKEIESSISLVDLGLNQNNTFYNARINFDKGNFTHNFGVQGNFLKNENQNKVQEILIPNANYAENGIYYMVNWDWNTYFIQGALRYDYRQVNADASDAQFIEQGFILPGNPESRTLESDFSGFTGSLGITKSLSKTQKLKANFSSGFRSPDLAELYSFGQHPGTSRFEIGNANFGREQSIQLDFNYSLSMDRFRLDWSIFGSQVNNYIFFADTGEIRSDSGLQIWEYQQVLAQLYGSELNLQYVALANRNLRFNLGAAMVRGENKDFDEPLTFIPPDNASLEVNYSFGKLQDTSVFTKVRGVAKQDQPGFNEEETSGFSLVDIGLSKIFEFRKSRSLEASVALQNVFNETYVDHLSILRAFNVPSPGRNLMLNLRYQF
ncbi:TonB-dependent receptor [Psychroflexus sediminis]|uniref:Iron complex outermembrane recepter protein n=1 Tax=Psychroflexus sediminis TaxID=470826 RepID=A0A1G7XY67_9FLAO|nr:TonB-dependent receptor [Psychroflexus sediminis]SDG89155.1 iron complex outermembrane recepter protein [Psychroflexus sediminis]